MVCDKCEKKLSKVVTPDPWRTKSSSASPSSAPGKDKGPKKSAPRYNPMGGGQMQTCRICRTKVHQVGSHYCQACAYKKGICAMCGKKILDTKSYRQSST